MSVGVIMSLGRPLDSEKPAHALGYQFPVDHQAGVGGIDLALADGPVEVGLVALPPVRRWSCRRTA